MSPERWFRCPDWSDSPSRCSPRSSCRISSTSRAYSLSLKPASSLDGRGVAQTPQRVHRSAETRPGHADFPHRDRPPRRIRAIPTPPIRSLAHSRVHRTNADRKSCANHLARFHCVANRGDGSKPRHGFASPLISSLRDHSKGVSSVRGDCQSRGGNHRRGASLRNDLSRSRLQYFPRLGASPPRISRKRLFL